MFLIKQAAKPSSLRDFRGCIWDRAKSTSLGANGQSKSSFIGVVTCGWTASKHSSILTGLAVEKKFWKYWRKARLISSFFVHSCPWSSTILPIWLIFRWWFAQAWKYWVFRSPMPNQLRLARCFHCMSSISKSQSISFSQSVGSSCCYRRLSLLFFAWSAQLMCPNLEELHFFKSIWHC